ASLRPHPGSGSAGQSPGRSETLARFHENPLSSRKQPNVPSLYPFLKNSKTGNHPSFDGRPPVFFFKKNYCFLFFFFFFFCTTAPLPSIADTSAVIPSAAAACAGTYLFFPICLNRNHMEPVR